MNEVEFPDFAAFMESAAMPKFLNDTSQIRLDGQQSVGNRRVFGKFRHAGSVWKVHDDSHFEPLFLAYYNFKFTSNGRTSTFVKEETDSTSCLELNCTLTALRESSVKQMYIYKV